MNKLTRKITLSLVAILFAIIALGTTTYAWFTLGTTATVSTISANVKTGEGIEVSLDGTTWVNALTFDENDAKFNGTSVGTGVALADVALKTGEYKFYTSTGAAEANKDYLAFDMYVKVTGENVKDKKLYANNVNIYSTKGADYTADVNTKKTTEENAEAALTSGTSYTVFASNAARVSFASALNTENATTTYKGTFKRATAQKMNYNELTQTEDAALTAGYTAFDGGSDEANGHAASYAAAKNYTGAKAMYDDDAYSSYVTRDNVTLSDAELELETITANPGQNPDSTKWIKVTVYVWLSGFDGDCINAILGAKGLNVSFGFELK